jgi:hypothetical protein
LIHTQNIENSIIIALNPRKKPHQLQSNLKGTRSIRSNTRKRYGRSNAQNRSSIGRIKQINLFDISFVKVTRTRTHTVHKKMKEIIIVQVSLSSLLDIQH